MEWKAVEQPDINPYVSMGKDFPDRWKREKEITGKCV
jgi:hypothetical protein